MGLIPVGTEGIVEIVVVDVEIAVVEIADFEIDAVDIVDELSE